LNTKAPYVATARWLALAFGLLIVWGSLYPVDFSLPTRPQLLERIARAHLYVASRTDLIANLLLYMPLGGVAVLAVAGLTRAGRIARAAGWGCMLSLSLELLQLVTPHRVTNVFDWALNTVGAAVGACAVTAYLMIGNRWHFSALLNERPALIPLGLLALWFAAQFLPYLPAHGAVPASKPWHGWVHASPLRWSLALATWWVIAECVRGILRPPWVLAALATLIGLNLLAHPALQAVAVRPEELASSCIAWLGAALTSQWPLRARAAVAVSACTIALVVQGLWPFVASERINEFHWVPFSGSLLTSRDYRPLFAALFLRGALLWSACLVLRRLGWAFAWSLGVALGIGLAQLWIPQRRAEITDLLLVVALAIAFAVARRFQVYAFAADSVVAPGRVDGATHCIRID